MQVPVSSDDVPLLWTQSPRFVQIMRNGSGFQHPHYFWNQSDKLTCLLTRLREDTTAFGPSDDYHQAQELLSQLLGESQCYSSLTREQLRQLEPSVRVFVDKLQNLDHFVAQWDERRRLMCAKAPSKKRGRGDEEEEEEVMQQEVYGSMKRRRNTAGSQAMELETFFAAPFEPVSPWIQAPPAQPALWTPSFST